VHRWEYRRGFIEALTVNPHTFLAHGEELLRLGPLREVRFVGAPVPWDELALSPQVARLQTPVVRLKEAGPLHRDADRASLTSEMFGGAEVVFRPGGHESERRLVRGLPGGLRIVLVQRGG
jgi:hypothetical protein